MTGQGRFVKITDMKRYKSLGLLEHMQADTRQLILTATHLQSGDPRVLATQPAPGKWSVLQVLAHLNSYGEYYLPALRRALQSDRPAAEYFTPGWLGDWFTKLMQPTEDGTIRSKMNAPKDHRPAAHQDPKPVIDTFLGQQQQLLELLELAKTRDIGAIRSPVSLSRFIRLKVGDTFRFLIAHEQRHFIQIQRTLEMVADTTGKSRAVHLAV